jgi:hypothetical protein
MMAFKRVLENILRKTSDLVKSTKDAVDEYDTPENREKITDSVLAASEATVKKVKGLGDLVAEYAEAPDFFKSKKLTSEPNRYEHPAEACEDISDAAYKKNKGSNTEPGRRLLRIIEQNYLHWEDLKGAEIFCPGIGKGTIEDVMERSKYIPLITVALLPDSHRPTVSSSRIQINSDTLKKDGVIITLGQTAKKNAQWLHRQAWRAKKRLG